MKSTKGRQGKRCELSTVYDHTDYANVPPSQDRCSVKPGTMVRLLREVGAAHEEAWVEVVRRKGSGYVGSFLKRGNRRRTYLEFGPEHVFGIKGKGRGDG